MKKPRLALGVLAPLLLAGAAAEVAVRRAFPGDAYDVYLAAPHAIRYLAFSTSPRLGFEPDAGRNPLADPAPAYFDGEINSLGFRDAEWKEEKGKTRVLVLGDWSAWGKDVEREEAFPRRLQERLGPAYRVYNGAVPGYNTCQETALLKERLAFLDPHLVLLAYGLNDRAEYYSVAPEGAGWRVRRKGPSRAYFVKAPLLEKSALYRWLNFKAAAGPLARWARFEDRPENGALGCLDELSEALRSQGKELVVAVFPALFPPGATPPFFEREKRVVLAHCAARGLRCLDLAAPLAERAGGDLAAWRARPGDHTHLNAAAHGVVAESLADFLARLDEAGGRR